MKEDARFLQPLLLFNGRTAFDWVYNFALYWAEGSGTIDPLNMIAVPNCKTFVAKRCLGRRLSGLGKSLENVVGKLLLFQLPRIWHKACFFLAGLK